MNLMLLENELRELADKTAAFRATLLAPVQECNILETLTRLRAVLGQDKYISITPPTFDWHVSSKSVIVGNWAVWDGERSFQAPTLAAATALCLESHKPPPPPELPLIVQGQIDAALAPLPL